MAATFAWRGGERCYRIAGLRQLVVILGLAPLCQLGFRSLKTLWPRSSTAETCVSAVGGMACLVGPPLEAGNPGRSTGRLRYDQPVSRRSPLHFDESKVAVPGHRGDRADIRFISSYKCSTAWYPVPLIRCFP